MLQPTVPGCVVLGRLGQGSSGTVWLAERAADGLRVAVKVLCGNGIADPAASSQALRELAVLTRAAGEHVVRLHEAVPLPGGGLALVLELADGGSLARVVAGRGHLSPGEAVTVLAPLAGALAGLHDAGVVHADVSPGNVLFTREGRPLLSDLGVARLVGETDGQVHGTSGFVAPEVLDGAAPTPASDVHALGALGWLSLTGAAPPPPAVRPPLATVAPEAPTALVAVVERCLAGEPADRPTAREVGVAVFDAASAEPVRLGDGSDPAQELTHRLRAQAASCEGPASVDLAGRPALTAALRRLGLRLGRRRAPSRDRRRGPARRRGALVALTGAVAVALLVPGAVVARSVSRGAGGPAPVSMPRHSAPKGPAVEGAVVRKPRGSHIGTRSAPATAPRELLQDLADLRADAWAQRDRQLLLAVDAPGSPALHTDLTQLAQLEAQEARYEEVRFTVRGATGTVRGDSATVRARVDTAGYTVVGADGTTQQRPGTRGKALTFRLSWTSQGWRIASYA